ncbi:unnamed protein product, partial [Ectocarpus sp. 12 AP-2014]
LAFQGKYEQADPLYLRAIEIWEAALGPNHPEVASGLNNRAGLLSILSFALSYFGADHTPFAFTSRNPGQIRRG